MKEISVQELAAMKAAGEDFQLIDVREPHEVEIAEIGGELIPLGTVPQNIDKFDKDRKVIIYCRSGKRSGQATQYLTQNFGYDNVYNLAGGILAYADEIDNSLTKY